MASRAPRSAASKSVPGRCLSSWYSGGLDRRLLDPPRVRRDADDDQRRPLLFEQFRDLPRVFLGGARGQMIEPRADAGPALRQARKHCGERHRDRGACGTPDPRPLGLRPLRPVDLDAALALLRDHRSVVRAEVADRVEDLDDLVVPLGARHVSIGAGEEEHRPSHLELQSIGASAFLYEGGEVSERRLVLAPSHLPPLKSAEHLLPDRRQLRSELLGGRLDLLPCDRN